MMHEVWNCIRTIPERCGKISAFQGQILKILKIQKSEDYL